MAEQDTHDQYKDLAHGAVRVLQRLTAPLNEGLKDLYPRTQIDTMSDQMTRNLLPTRGHAHLGRDLIWSWQRCTLVAPSSHPSSVTLRMSRSAELFSDGAFLLRLWVHVGPEKTLGAFYDWQSDDVAAPVGTIQLEKLLQDGIAQLSQALKQAVYVFVEHLPADNGVS